MAVSNASTDGIPNAFRPGRQRGTPLGRQCVTVLGERARVADVAFDGLYCMTRRLPNITMGNQNRKASPEILWRLSTNLRKLRQARGYTQQELAKICGFSNSYIGNVEQGTVNITLANLETLAIGLGCAEEDLLRRPSGRGVVRGR